MRTLQFFLALGMTFVLTACTTTGGPAFPLKRDDPKRPRIALVLGGGAARGFAHVGVIRALEQERIPIDLIVGTSVGSLIGAVYAYDLNSFELEWTAFKLEKEHLFDYALMSAVRGMGMVKGEKLEEFVKTKVPVKNIEDLKMPFVAVATDLNRGTRVVLDRGPVARAVRASSAIPGVFEPVKHQGRLLVDGGVIDNIPVSVARAKKADIVIAVDIGENVRNFKISNLVDVMLQSVNIMFNENVGFKKKEADILIRPSVGSVAMLDFSKKKEAMRAGIDATRSAMPEIKKAIRDWMNK